MGRYAQSRRRGGGGTLTVAQATAIPAGPVLTLTPPATLTWTWSGPNPTSWDIGRSVSPAGPFDTWDQASGDTRAQEESADGAYYALTGVDEADHPVTGQSNIIQTENPP